MLHFRGEFSLIFENQIGLLEKNITTIVHFFVAPIVALNACRFYMKFFRLSPWRLLCMQVKLISALKNKEQLIRFRVNGKSATSAQADGDG